MFLSISLTASAASMSNINQANYNHFVIIVQHYVVIETLKISYVFLWTVKTCLQYNYQYSLMAEKRALDRNCKVMFVLKLYPSFLVSFQNKCHKAHLKSARNALQLITSESGRKVTGPSLKSQPQFHNYLTRSEFSLPLIRPLILIISKCLPPEARNVALW